MEERSDIKDVFARLVLPETRTSEPCIFVAGGWEKRAGLFFDALREFFPLVFIASNVVSGLSPKELLDLCGLATAKGLCPFFAAGDVHHSKLSCLAAANEPVKLFWVADCGSGLPSRFEADRIEWLNSQLGTERYFLINVSQDLYPQIFSLPFLPGRRR